MGLDLTLCPFRHGARNWHGSHLAFVRLSLDRNYDLLGQIGQNIGGEGVTQICKPHPLPPGMEFQWYGDEGLETTPNDPYGDPLTYVLAGELAKVKLPEKSGNWNEAVFAMMRALEPNTPVVLWWH